MTIAARNGNVLRLRDGDPRVYRNLHKNVFSLQAVVPSKGQPRVVAHGLNFIGADVDFRISEAGRARALKMKQRNVHAWAVPSYISHFDAGDVEYEILHPITYNPWEHGYFYNPENGDAVTHCEHVLFADDCALFAIRLENQ